MIPVQLRDDLLLGVGFSYQSRGLTQDEERVIRVVNHERPLMEDQLKRIRRELTRSRLISTTCTLYEIINPKRLKDSEVLCAYTEHCSEDDNFSKEKGRKLALQWVIEKMDNPRLSKLDRKMIWEAYHARKEPRVTS